MLQIKGFKNLYVCSNTHELVTVHRESGRTPMVISCPLCGEHSNSKSGNVHLLSEPTWEWYKPNQEDVLQQAYALANKYQLDIEDVLPGFEHHVELGGLLMRKIQ